MKNTLFVKTTASPITTKRRVFCPLVDIIGNVQELLKKLDTFCFTYQHVDCLYTLFKYGFSGKVIAKSGQVFDNVQRAVDFNNRNKGVDRMPSVAKKRLLRKRYRKIFFSAPSKRQKQRRPVIQCMQKKLKKLKKTKFEFEVIKIVDCFLDSHGKIDSSLVSYKNKTL